MTKAEQAAVSDYPHFQAKITNAKTPQELFKITDAVRNYVGKGLSETEKEALLNTINNILNPTSDSKTENS